MPPASSDSHPGLLERLRRRRRPNVRIDAAYARWRARHVVASTATSIPGPLISVVMPVFDPPVELLAAAVASVGAQTYERWELCIADDASPAVHVAPALDALAAADARIRVVRLDRNHGIAGATNAALHLASGLFVALLDQDDELAPDALARFAAEIGLHPDAEMIFSDEDKRVGAKLCCPYFKPGWNPDLMLCQNAVSHLGVYRRDRLVQTGGLRDGLDGSQDYELALRFAAAGAAKIRHIPEVLYHWRQRPDSYSARHAEWASQAGRTAVALHASAGATVQPDPVLPQWNRVVYPVVEPAPLVSILVGGDGEAPADPGYRNIEVLQAGSVDMARGSVLLFVSPNLQPYGAGWVRELVSQALRPEIGAAGARLDRPDGRILQSGFILDSVHIAQTLQPRSDLDDPGYVGHFRLQRTVSAVSRACMAIRRGVFLQAGGFDAACEPFADVDLCLRLAASGLRCVWTPQARLRSMGAHRIERRMGDRAATLMRARWGDILARDPYFNPNLTVRNGNLVLAGRPGSERKHLPV